MKCEHRIEDVEIEYVDHHMYQGWCKECGARSNIFKDKSEMYDDDAFWRIPRREQNK